MHYCTTTIYLTPPSSYNVQMLTIALIRKTCSSIELGTSALVKVGRERGRERERERERE